MEEPREGLRNGDQLTSRCDVCKGPFRVIVEGGRFLDAEDRTRHVRLERGRYVHARCERGEGGED